MQRLLCENGPGAEQGKKQSHKATTTLATARCGVRRLRALRAFHFENALRALSTLRSFAFSARKAAGCERSVLPVVYIFCKQRSLTKPKGKRQPSPRQRHTDNDNDFFGPSSVQAKRCLYPYGSLSSPTAKTRADVTTAPKTRATLCRAGRAPGRARYPAARLPQRRCRSIAGPRASGFPRPGPRAGQDPAGLTD